MPHTTYISALATALAAGLACSTITEIPDRPLRITLTAEPRSALVGQEIGFRFEAQGRFLLGVVVEYGDGTQDSLATFGATTATSNLRHAYSVAGRFLVSARADESTGRVTQDTLSVQILAPRETGRWSPANVLTFALRGPYPVPITNPTEASTARLPRHRGR